jgi:hypothetical protein
MDKRTPAEKQNDARRRSEVNRRIKERGGGDKAWWEIVEQLLADNDALRAAHEDGP